MKDQDLREILKLFLTARWTKEVPRQGFVTVGFKKDEVDSVAAHSYCVTLLSYLFASQLKREGENIDVNKTVKIALLHDLEESITGDIGTMTKKFANRIADGFINKIEQQAYLALVKNLKFSEEMKELKREYDELKTLEARVVKAADLIDALAQGLSTAGADKQKFIDNHPVTAEKTNLDFHKRANEMLLNNEVEAFWEWEKE